MKFQKTIKNLGLLVAILVVFFSTTTATNAIVPFVTGTSSLVNRIGSIGIGSIPATFSSSTSKCTNTQTLADADVTTGSETCLHVGGVANVTAIASFDNIIVKNVAHFLNTTGTIGASIPSRLVVGTNQSLAGNNTTQNDALVVVDDPAESNESILVGDLRRIVSGVFQPRGLTDPGYLAQNVCADVNGQLQAGTCSSSTPSVGYDWHEGLWSTCSTPVPDSCSGGSKMTTHPNGYVQTTTCAGFATSETACTDAFVAGSGICTWTDGTMATATRTITCRDAAANIVDYSFCDAATKPDETDIAMCADVAPTVPTACEWTNSGSGSGKEDLVCDSSLNSDGTLVGTAGLYPGSILGATGVTAGSYELEEFSPATGSWTSVSTGPMVYEAYGLTVTIHNSNPLPFNKAFRVRAVNTHGSSDWSYNSLLDIDDTTPYSYSAMLTANDNGSIMMIGGGGIKVSWQSPDNDLSGGLVDSYVIGRCIGSSCSGYFQGQTVPANPDQFTAVKIFDRGDHGTSFNGAMSLSSPNDYFIYTDLQVTPGNEYTYVLVRYQYGETTPAIGSTMEGVGSVTSFSPGDYIGLTPSIIKS